MTRIEWGTMKARKAMRQRKDRYIIRGIKKVAIGAALCAVAALSLGAADAHPYELVEEVYVVQSGDNLWSIGERFMGKNTYGHRYFPEFIEGIKQLNPELVEAHGQVEPGQRLRITYWITKE